MHIAIYHNPKCSNSRSCLEIIRAEGYEPTIIEYLKFPPTAPELERLIARMGTSPRDTIRAKEPVYAELDLDEATDERLLAAIAANPILLNRPIVVTDKGAKLCRPPELVRALL
jgi:arsenate reductase